MAADITESLDHAPARLSTLVALLAAVVAIGMISLSSIILAIPVGAVSLILLGLGLASGYRAPIGLGVAILFFGTLITGTFLNASTEALLIGIIAIILSWDVGENAIGVGEQLTRGGRTQRTEAVHIASTALVGIVGGGLAYGVFRASTGGKPLPALIFLLVGVVFAGWLIRQ